MSAPLPTGVPILPILLVVLVLLAVIFPYPNQFALLSLREAERATKPRSWRRRRWQRRVLLHHPGLPIEELDGGRLLLGWKFPGGGGRWLELDPEGRVRPDACASLTAFTDGEGAVVSSMQLAADLGIAGARDPQATRLRATRERTGIWHPAGLSPRRRWRLQLPLPQGSPVGTALGQPCSELVDRFIAGCREHLEHWGARFPLEISLTAGRDSRMVAACSRSVRAVSRYFVEPPRPPHRGPEVEISTTLAEILDLEHRVGGEPRPEAALAFGFGGELARGHYWPENLDDQPTVEALAAALWLDPVEDAYLLPELERWRDGLGEIAPMQLWDRLYLEQRMACTMAPLLHERDLTARVSFFALGCPAGIEVMTSLPAQFRKEWKLAGEVCRRAWPASGLLPFNTVDYTLPGRAAALARLRLGRGPDFDRARRNNRLRRWLSGSARSPVGGLVRDLVRKVRPRSFG